MKLLILSYVALLASTPVLVFQDRELSESMRRGKALYSDFCISCHMDNGAGVASVFPPLAQSDFLAQNRKESIRGVKYGRSGAIVVNGVSYDNVMVAAGLEDDEIADVMNYIMNAWGNTSDHRVTEEEVASIEPK